MPKETDLISKELRKVLRQYLIQLSTNPNIANDIQNSINKILDPKRGVTLLKETKVMCVLYNNLINNTLLPVEGKNNFDVANELGFQIIFNLRRIISGFDITFLLSTSTPDNSLPLNEIPMEKIISSNFYEIRNNGVYLINELFEMNKMQTAAQTGNRYGEFGTELDHVWQRILNASQLTGPDLDFNATNDNTSEKIAGKRGLRAYKRNKHNKDTKVYYTIANNRKSATQRNYHYYYDIDGQDKLQYFNRGWLFEHLMEKWLNASTSERENMIQQSMGDHPVGVAIAKGDSVPGTQGGDFRGRIEENNKKIYKDFQAKFNNKKIVSGYLIKQTMHFIDRVLNEYDKIDELGELLISRYSPYGTKESTLFSDKNLDKIENMLMNYDGVKSVPKAIQDNIITALKSRTTRRWVL